MSKNMNYENLLHFIGMYNAQVQRTHLTIIGTDRRFRNVGSCEYGGAY